MMSNDELLEIAKPFLNESRKKLASIRAQILERYEDATPADMLEDDLTWCGSGFDDLIASLNAQLRALDVLEGSVHDDEEDAKKILMKLVVHHWDMPLKRVIDREKDIETDYRYGIADKANKVRAILKQVSKMNSFEEVPA